MSIPVSCSRKKDDRLDYDIERKRLRKSPKEGVIGKKEQSMQEDLSTISQ